MHTTYSSPLSARYASSAMLELWSPQERHRLWRELWIALAEAEMELGIDIPAAAIAEMRAAVNDIDFDAAAKYEQRFRHDVMAHVHTFGDAAPSARRFIHLGATSAFVTDNADLVLMHRGLEMLRDRCIDVLRALALFADTWKGEPTLGYTHLQPAQLTTVGKRATLWMHDLVLDVRDIEYRLASMPLRGVKGTTGTQATFLQLFNGDDAKVRELDRRVTAKMGFSESVPVSGQTYTRKIDAGVLGVVAGVAASAGKFASDMRMLQAFGEIEEPFEKEQIGSSAMAYKRNPMRSERINSLVRYVLSLETNANETHSVQYFERTLDDSANRRLVIPEMFLAADAIMLLFHNIASGLEVHTARIASRVADELPFMATEDLILRAVAAGGDRQVAHETIRRHSVAAARAMKDGAPHNDMLDRLSRDPDFAVPLDDLRNALDARNFIGRSSAQVTDFLREVAEPLIGTAPEPSHVEVIRV